MAYTYIPLMMDHCHGFPLWFLDPDLSLPDCYRAKGIRVGDLGYITARGGFTYLFNVYASADDPINEGRVPPIFEPLEVSDPPARERELHPKHYTLATPGVHRTAIGVKTSTEGVLTSGGVGLTFACSSTQGAGLVLPDGATRYDANNPAQLYKYAKKYAQYWYQYLNGEEGMEMRNGSLYLVTGCDKCHSWEAACFHPPRHSSVFPTDGVAEVGGAFSHSWEVQTGPHYRIHRRDTTDPNQAIFLRGYTISVREKPTVHEQLLAKKPTDTVIGGSKAKGPLIDSPVPYGVESPFRYGIPVGDMDMHGVSEGNDSEDHADFSDGYDPEDPEDVEGSSQVEIFAVGHGHNVYNPSAKINARSQPQMLLSPTMSIG
ncbi:hypothetical protein ARMGADRAFT_578106 [Armillaria gallica]|uniref:Uncharacterized protein n=1 Tax=Armillaria gallica TaxID=47427 RepID=A0A2H3EAT6_ARMGA|nr:hypothetical protein ARMGADRAFT_578106 [Armillaria gallica]